MVYKLEDYLNRRSYYYGGLVKQGKNKGKHKFTVGNKNKRTKYFTDYDEGKKWEAGERKIKFDLDKPKGKKFPKSELNKAAQFLFKKNYDDLVDQKQKSKAYDRVRNVFRTTGQKKFKAKNLESPLSKTDQAKIKKVFPDAVFKQGQKFGFAFDSPEYDTVRRFVERGFKKSFEGGQMKSLPKYAQQELINAFPDVKFDFKDRSRIEKTGSTTTGYSKYGIPSNHPRYQSIRAYLDDPKPFRYGFNLRTAEGWTLGQMDRAALHGDTRYEPILQKPGKPISKNNKVIGIVDKTGRTTKKYNAENILKTHPNREEIIKYVDVANKSRTPLANYPTISKLLPEGFDPEKIQLNDLLQFIAKDKRGINRAKRAIEIHHVEGVKNKATGNFQLLRRDLNKLADTIEQQISKGNLDRAAELDAQRIRVETGGVKYGGKTRTPEGDFRALLKGVETELKDPKFKFNEFKKAIAKMSPNKTCAVGRRPKAEGGGVSGLDDCFREGMQALKEKNINKPHQIQGAKQLMNAGKRIGASTFARRLLDLGILGEVAFIAGDAGIRMAMGRPFSEAFKAATFREGQADKERQQRAGFTEREMLIGEAQDLSNKALSLQQQIAAAEAVGDEASVPALEASLKNVNEQLQKTIDPAGTKLQSLLTPTSATNIEATRKLENIIDADRAKSLYTQSQLRDVQEGVPGIADYAETETPTMQALTPEREVLPGTQEYLRGFMRQSLPESQELEDRTIDRFVEQLSPMEKFELEVLDPRRSEILYGTQGKFAEGGLTNLTRTVAPQSGPNAKGLESLRRYATRKY